MAQVLYNLELTRAELISLTAVVITNTAILLPSEQRDTLSAIYGKLKELLEG